jgi:hypothetical protein
LVAKELFHLGQKARITDKQPPGFYKASIDNIRGSHGFLSWQLDSRNKDVTVPGANKEPFPSGHAGYGSWCLLVGIGHKVLLGIFPVPFINWLSPEKFPHGALKETESSRPGL